MKLAIFGATGAIGSAITHEALERGHSVTAIVRDTTRLTITHPRLHSTQADLRNAAQVTKAMAGHDAVIASIGGRRENQHDIVPEAARILIRQMPKASVQRILWVGGAGGLEAMPGLRVIDTPEFPDAWKDEALAQIKALEIFQTKADTIDWTYLSPAALIQPGKRTGTYRIGTDQLVTDEKGESHISTQDYAVALLDELENPAHIRQRFTVAY